MSLSEAVLDIADQLEEEGLDLCQDPAALVSCHFGDTLRTYARQLRTAVKAGGGEQQAAFQFPDPQAQHRAMIEAARAEFRGKVQSIEGTEGEEREEGSADVLVDAVGGPAGGCAVAVPPGMPPGAKTNFGGAVYQLREDGKLHYEEPKA